MKKRKPAGPEPGEESPSRQDAAAVVNAVRWAEEREPSRSSATGPPRMEPEAMGPEAVTPGSAHNHKLNHKVKRRGRLDRAVLAMLGKGLEDCFDEVRKQEVPERFKLLLRQF